MKNETCDHDYFAIEIKRTVSGVRNAKEGEDTSFNETTVTLHALVCRHCADIQAGAKAAEDGQ